MSNNEFEKVSYKKNKNKIYHQATFQNLQNRLHSPKVDLVESNDTYLVRIELPGVLPETTKIQIKDHQIIFVSGSKEQYPTYETDHVIYKESKYDNFVRRIKLPGPIKYFNLNEPLKFSNGVLYLTFEKTIREHHEKLNIDNINENINEKIDWSEL